MVDWFMAGMCEPAGDVPPEKMAELSRVAEDYLRVGKGLSWAEWTALGPQSQAAFLHAANRLWTERAAMFGLAATSVEAALEVASKLDGGRAKVAAAMTRVMEKTAARLRETAA